MKKKLLPILILAIAILGACKKDAKLSEKAATLSVPTKLMSTGSAGNPYGLNNWMGAIGDLTQIDYLSVPGTHNSAARVEYMWGTAKCQNLTISEQLNAGVRFLDIRCRHIGNAFVIHHGEVYQKITFQDVLNACYDFLNRNPTEMIIMSIKEEYNPAANSRSFEQTFDAYVGANPGKWNLEQVSGILKNSRGKIKLFRRFAAQTPKGINATRWGNNTLFDVANYDNYMRVQDFYHVGNLGAKAEQIRSLLYDARFFKADILYVNFASGYRSRWFGIPDITSVSNAMNIALSNYLTANSRGRYGIIATDFIYEGLSRQIINSNF